MTEPRRSHWRQTLFFKLSLRLAAVAGLFMMIQVALVVWMYVGSPAELDQLLISAEANRIANAIAARPPGPVPALSNDLLPPVAPRTRRAFVVHDRGGRVIAQHDDRGLAADGAAPASFLVVNTQRETWGDHFLLTGTRRVTIAGKQLWITMAIAGTGFRPFVPIIFNEIRFHVLLPIVLLSILFLLLNFSIVRSTLKPLNTAIAAIDRIDPAAISTRITAPLKSWEVEALIGAVNRLLTRVERLILTLRDFVGNAAHELRTPLAIMMLGIGKLPHDDNRTRLLHDVQGMKRLVDQMLDMAQANALVIEAGAQADLTRIAADVVADLMPLAIARGRTIVFVDEGAEVIHGHAEAIGRALRNVIENGLAHTPPGTAVEVTCGPGRRYAVRDHGPGIPESQRANVVKRFQRLDRRNNDGAGLGLAITLTVMEDHGGRLDIADSPGGGALVCLIFL
ncbi:MAG: HAMP domain-containing sensor histidine kinase [Acidiphilium sp.]|nr:HAMP domain-containing sensor histidine kinase [Acidiphilium sp.]MDD4936754.1 HAMP domain-containing sensor histidine kinase [Acidiphilium sp.]